MKNDCYSIFPLLCRFHVVTASYLQTPRINFAGRFRADVNTINNRQLNYLLSTMPDEHAPLDDDWNPQGTNTWVMIDCYVTSVVYTDENGDTKVLDSPTEDSIIGLPLVNNPERAFAKLVDVDPDQQQSSTVYGMDLGVNWAPSKGEDQTDAFIGDFVPAVITRDIWVRQIRHSTERLQQPMASHSISRLENITWSTTLNSDVLKMLSQSEDLSIMFSVYNYTRPPPEPWFTYGNVVGSIGIAEEGESLSFPENRVMYPSTDSDTLVLPLPPDNPCKDTTDWLYTTYFDVKDSKMTIDFSSSFKIDLQGNICHFYPFYVGIAVSKPQLSSNSDEITEIEIIGEIPYMEESWYDKTAGISEFTLSESQQDAIGNSKVVVVMLYDPSRGIPLSKPELRDNSNYPICDLEQHSQSSRQSCVYIILEESPYLVRPMEYQVHRMEENDEVDVTFKVKHYGQIPNEAVTINLIDMSTTKAKRPDDLDYNSTTETDSNGIAHFQFIAGNVGEPRSDLHLDGQLFRFGYCLEHTIDDCNQCSESTNIGNTIVFLVWSPIQNKRPYFWDDDLQPILYQYERLYPVMRSILKLGDYYDVIKPANLRLLYLSMSLDITHPSYMPVTRDLSPKKKEMILEWLSTPNHPRSWEDIEHKLFESPHFCNHTIFAVRETKKCPNKKQSRSESEKSRLYDTQDVDVDQTVDEKPSLADSDISHHFLSIATPPPSMVRPSMNIYETCSVAVLKEALQIAINLEFSTIPPYLTALYSIKDGHNRFVYDTIRSVVMQEMLHLAQAANLLISIGGTPLIDDPSVAITYPTKLPGDVLPGLIVTLRKASPKHIANVFMMIEFPDEVIKEYAYHDKPIDTNALTIGRFYNSVKKCMKELYKNDEITFGHTDKQLHWPWPMYDKSSNLYKVDSMKTAKKAIRMIVEQGEGSKQMDPTYLKTDKLAHFFKFEELACKHHLQTFHEHDSYSFEGDEIEFVPEGVWPMRDDPSSKTIPKDSYIYHEAKIFHLIYRSLLTSLQTAFDGNADAINDAVYIMEMMQIQAKKLMQMEMPNIPSGHPKQTCGPVFEYEWGSEETQ